MADNPYKRIDWNNLIQTVKAIITNPPSGCNPLSSLAEIEEEHRWSKADIRAIQTALSATCPDIVWETIPDKWKQSIIDEIRSNMGLAWCNCNGPPDCSDTGGIEIASMDPGEQCPGGSNCDNTWLIDIFLGQYWTSGNVGNWAAEFNPDAAHNIGGDLNGLPLKNPGCSGSWKIWVSGINWGFSYDYIYAGGNIEDGKAVCGEIWLPNILSHIGDSPSNLVFTFKF